LESRWVAFLAAAVVALFSLGAGILLLGSVRKPIEALLQGTDHIAAGRLDYRIPVLTRDEFGQLASHFNQMAGELQRQQDNLRESHAVLERRVAERTLELNQLNEELQQRDTERREFLADISHELRTPITVIRGEAEVTLRGPLREAEEYREALLRVADLSEQLGKYVNDLMVIARADNACLQFEWSRVDLAGLVSCAVEDIRVMAEEYLVSVWLDLPAATPVWVWADKERLRQVLFILGDNACRYSKAGGHIALDLKVEAGQALFSISDLGIGIPAKDLGRVFDRHFRSTNARLVRGDGSGLGLPLAKSIIQAHEGQISVTSVENAGTTFLVSLPLSLSEESVSERTRA
jgi:signal transduction histidine kinase